MATVSPEVGLALFGHRTALFKKYGNYLETRISRDTGNPIEEPITELGEALVLLYEGRSDRSQRRLILNAQLPNGGFGPVIQIEIFNGGYTKDELSGTYEFPISPELVKELKTSGILSGTQHMGYTDDSELRLNERAAVKIIEEINTFAEAHPSE